jgi:hypothetical protein
VQVRKRGLGGGDAHAPRLANPRKTCLRVLQGKNCFPPAARTHRQGVSPPAPGTHARVAASVPTPDHCTPLTRKNTKKKSSRSLTGLARRHAARRRRALRARLAVAHGGRRVGQREGPGRAGHPVVGGVLRAARTVGGGTTLDAWRRLAGGDVIARVAHGHARGGRGGGGGQRGRAGGAGLLDFGAFRAARAPGADACG